MDTISPIEVGSGHSRKVRALSGSHRRTPPPHAEAQELHLGPTPATLGKLETNIALRRASKEKLQVLDMTLLGFLDRFVSSQWFCANGGVVNENRAKFVILFIT